MTLWKKGKEHEGRKIALLDLISNCVIDEFLKVERNVFDILNSILLITMIYIEELN